HKQAFDENAATGEEARQSPHCAGFAERDQGAEVAVYIGLQWLAAQSTPDLVGYVSGFLMRSLRPGRHGGGFPRPWAGRTVADCEDRGIARRHQCRLDDELVEAVDLQTVESSQHLRTFDAGRPYHELGRDKGAIGQPDALSRHFLYPDSGVDLHAHLVEH